MQETISVYIPPIPGSLSASTSAVVVIHTRAGATVVNSLVRSGWSGLVDLW
jgi:hypothetical protein